MNALPRGAGAAPVARLELLGQVRIVAADRDVVLHGHQPQGALVRLVHERGRPVGTGDLAEMLWPSARPQHWEGSLRGVMAKVRVFLGTLGPGAATVASLGRSYRFACRPDVRVDLWEIEANLALARQLLDDGDAAGSAVVAELTATALRNPLLPGESGAWVEQRRTEIDRLRLRAFRKASLSCTACGRHDEAIEWAGAAVAEDPFDEENHRALMRALDAAGNRAAAVRAYERCRRLMADELGINPSSTTQRLYLDLLGVGE